MYRTLQETAFGWLALLGSDTGSEVVLLHRTSLQPDAGAALDGLGEAGASAADCPAVFAGALAAFARYFAGDGDALAGVPLALPATAPAFHRAAWDACRTIPPGETRSYRWLAAAAGNPKASRAAGQAMARNPLPLLIPCHRVVGSSGRLHGYGAGGIGVKARLLELESGRTATAGQKEIAPPLQHLL